MAKLPPPYIEGSIPAQISDGFIIPFDVNRAVGINLVDSVVAKIKSVATNNLIATLETTNFTKNPTNNQATFTWQTNDSIPVPVTLTPGQHYKVQLAFKSGGEVGYFSSIGVFKYTNKPEVTISYLEDGEIGNQYTYTGVYENADSTEKVYSYQFIVKANTGAIIADSGVLIHDSTKDTIVNSSTDTWILNQVLKLGITYEITYSITTINNLTASKSYNIVNNELHNPAFNGCEIQVENDYDNGCISVKLKSTTPISKQGGFVVGRADSRDNYNTWQDLMTFTLSSNAVLPEELWKDYTVEQGISYKYCLQQFNDSGFYSTRLTNEIPVTADFEDMFLYDGFRQLKIRFNPKVTSFKNTVLETKVDTIGGKYPFIFRNGDVKYKEFPIGGLISYLSDPSELFMSDYELGFIEEHAHRHATNHNEELRTSTRGTQVDTTNIAAERNFKLTVLDWLTDGKPKLFRSPSEGNYIVRLMNTSLTPNDTLSRMIHSFTSTAYEIAEYTFENLVKYNFVRDVQIADEVFNMHSLDLNFDTVPYHNLLQDYPRGVQTAQFVNVTPGVIFHLTFANQPGYVSIQIPQNGYYNVNIYQNPLMSISLHSLPEGVRTLQGLLDIGYYAQTQVGNFGNIEKVKITSATTQFIGSTVGGNIVDEIANYEDDHQKIGYCYSLKVETREIQDIWQSNNKYYTDAQCTSELVNYNRNKLYIICGGNDTGQYIDGRDQQKYSSINTIMTIGINNNPRETIDLGSYNSGEYMLPSVERISYLSLGNGLSATLVHQKLQYIYVGEEE